MRLFPICVWLLSLAVATVVLFSSPPAWAQTQAQARKGDAAPPGNAEQGKRLYTKYGCYSCHGREGQGSPATGSRLGPDPIPFQAFVFYTRQPAGQMPPYTAKVLSDQELADMYAFLRSLPRPPAVRSIPLLH